MWALIPTNFKTVVMKHFAVNFKLEPITGGGGDGHVVITVHDIKTEHVLQIRHDDVMQLADILVLNRQCREIPIQRAIVINHTKLAMHFFKDDKSLANKMFHPW